MLVSPLNAEAQSMNWGCCDGWTLRLGGTSACEGFQDPKNTPAEGNPEGV